MSTRLPKSASVAVAQRGAKLHAPAAARNAEALVALLQAHAPDAGRALEIASGTGQHVTAFASTLPDLIWQPTEIDRARRASIDAHVAEAGVANVAPAVHLDATTAGWADRYPAQDLIVLINLLHLIPQAAARTLITEAAQALGAGGRLILYGPFKRAGVLTSAGDRRFDADLRNADLAIGYKDDRDMLRWLKDAGLECQRVEMPANNLAFVARKHRT